MVIFGLFEQASAIVNGWLTIRIAFNFADFIVLNTVEVKQVGLTAGGGAA